MKATKKDKVQERIGKLEGENERRAKGKNFGKGARTKGLILGMTSRKENFNHIISQLIST